jgi:hypothetical protein
VQGSGLIFSGYSPDTRISDDASPMYLKPERRADVDG